MITASILALTLLAQVEVDEDFGFTLKAIDITSGSSYVAQGLLTADLSDDIAELTLTNNGSNPSTSAAGTAKFEIVWTPAYQGETAPADLIVSVGRSYKFKASGNGICKLTDSNGAIVDSINGSDTSFNNSIGLELEQDYTLPLTPRTDGTATAILLVPTNTLTATYNSAGSTPTVTTQYLSISEIKALRPFAPLRKK